MSESNPNLYPFRVSLHEEKGDKFTIHFNCDAEDSEHAIEQAEDAYPGCEIIHATQFDGSDLAYYIFSPSEHAIDGRGFWNNLDGWTLAELADKFSYEEKAENNLPISLGNDARWVLIERAAEVASSVNDGGKSVVIPCSVLASLIRMSNSHIEDINSGLEDGTYDASDNQDIRSKESALAEAEAIYRKSSLQAEPSELAFTTNTGGSEDESEDYTVTVVMSVTATSPDEAAAFAIDDIRDLTLSAVETEVKRESSGLVTKVTVTNSPADESLRESSTRVSNIEVSLDGGVSHQPAPEGVRIIYKGVMIDGEDGRGEVHINATHEGLITDIWTTRDEPLDHNIGTESVMIEDIVSRLVGGNV